MIKLESSRTINELMAVILLLKSISVIFFVRNQFQILFYYTKNKYCQISS